MAIRAKVMANNMFRLFISLLHKKEQKKSLRMTLCNRKTKNHLSNKVLEEIPKSLHLTYNFKPISLAVN